MSNHVSDMEELFFRALFWIADDHIAILKRKEDKERCFYNDVSGKRDSLKDKLAFWRRK